MSKAYVTLKGKIKWAHRLFVPDNFKGKEFYSVSLEMTPENFEVIKTLGTHGPQRKTINAIKNSVDRNDGVMYYTARSSFKPEVVDKKLNPYTGSIGNGTVANVKLMHEDVVDKDGDYTRIKLVGVQVLDVVEYESKDPSGFTAVEDNDSEDSKDIPF